MNFDDYCKHPDNERCIIDLMYDMKGGSGFDVDRLVEWVEDQAYEEDVFLAGFESSEDCYEFFSKWYDEIDYDRNGSLS